MANDPRWTCNMAIVLKENNGQISLYGEGQRDESFPICLKRGGGLTNLETNL